MAVNGSHGLGICPLLSEFFSGCSESKLSLSNEEVFTATRQSTHPLFYKMTSSVGRGEFSLQLNLYSDSYFIKLIFALLCALLLCEHHMDGFRLTSPTARIYSK